MTDSLRGKTAIVGAAQAGLGEAPGRSSMEIAAEAAHVALAEAGLTTRDVDGLFAGFAVHNLPTLSAAEYLGIRPKFMDGTMVGGSSFVGHILNAAMALDEGICDVALIVYGSNQRTDGGKLRSISEIPIYEGPYHPRNPISAYALAASRHMYEYGTTREHLAEVAVSARKWAQLNPEAFARDELTIDDVLGARMISDPFGLYDCCLVTDGGGALVMVRADRARDHPKPPIYMLGTGTATTHRQISMMPNLTQTAAVDSSARAYEMAGVKQADVDVIGIYDAFTLNTLVILEDLGFCKKGEGGEFVSGGRIAPGGELPVNTNGGGLSCVHPGMYGIFVAIEIVRQLRAEAGERQVEGAKIGIAHGNGGTLSSQITSILGTGATL